MIRSKFSQTRNITTGLDLWFIRIEIDGFMPVQEDRRRDDEHPLLGGIVDHIGELSAVVIPSAPGEENLRLRSLANAHFSRIHSRIPSGTFIVSFKCSENTVGQLSE